MIDHLNWRYATKKFDPSKKIPKQELAELLEVLRLSPSSHGLQPWRFMVIHDAVLRAKLRPFASDKPQITDSDTLIVFCCLKNLDENYISQYFDRMAQVRDISRESLNGFEQRVVGSLKTMSTEALSSWMKHQIYLALGMLLCECAHRRIDACPMEGFDSKKFDAMLDLSPLGLQSVVLCAVGYRALDDKYAQLQKVRFDANEVFIDQ